LEILLTSAYTLLFIFIILKLPFFKLKGVNNKTLPAILLIKIAAGVFMSFIYTHYYSDRQTADIFKYFDDSKVMYNALFTHPFDYFRMLFGFENDSPHFDLYYKQMNNWYRVYESNIYNDSHTIIRFNAFLRLFSFGYYNVHTAFMCFISLIGFVCIYKFFINYMKDKSKELFFAVFLLPSVIFWCSGVLKEGLLIFGLGLLLYYSYSMINIRFSFIALFWIFVSLIILMFLKFYILITIFPLLIIYLIINNFHFKRSGLIYSAVVLLGVFVGLNIQFIFPDFNILTILVNKQQDFIHLAKAMNSGSIIEIGILEPNFWSFVINAPMAFFNTLFRPFFFESISPFIIMAGFENLLILVIMIFCILYVNIRKTSANLFWFCLYFVMITFILTGLITPVMGAIVRYKVPALPFLIILFLLILDKEKLLNKFPFLKKHL